jgi:hypothetical protein
MKHPNYFVLSQWNQGELTPSESAHVAEHVATCALCTREVALMEASNAFIATNSEFLGFEFTNVVMSTVYNASQRQSSLTSLLVPTLFLVFLLGCGIWISISFPLAVHSFGSVGLGPIQTVIHSIRELAADRTILSVSTSLVAIAAVLFFEMLITRFRNTPPAHGKGA